MHGIVIDTEYNSYMTKMRMLKWRYTPGTLLTRAAAIFPFNGSVCTESSKDKIHLRISCQGRALLPSSDYLRKCTLSVTSNFLERLRCMCFYCFMFSRVIHTQVIVRKTCQTDVNWEVNKLDLYHLSTGLKSFWNIYRDSMWLKILISNEKWSL